MNRAIVLLSVAFLWTSDLWNQSDAADAPKVFQVDASGQPGATSIQAAIDAAPAGSIVRIGPGTFHGAVLIKKPVTLEGAGADRTFLSANWISLRELILEGKGVPDKDKEDFNKLQKIAIEQEKGEGPVTMQLIQTYGPKPTLAVKEISDCDVRGCGYAGVQIQGTGDVSVTRCRISKVDFHGIRYDNASPTIAGNVFSDINRAGIYLDGKTKGKISENLFFDCGAAGGTEDDIFNNTFTRKNGPSAAWHDFSAIGTSVTSKGKLHHNVISGYNHALVLYSTGQKPLKFDNLKFEGNICQTVKSAIIHAHHAVQKSRVEPRTEPEIVDVPLPEGNWQMQVQFTDPEHGNYSLSPQFEWPDRNCGATKHTSLKSPWPEQEAERAMLQQIKEVESQNR